jgi:phosphopantothenoylcysteine decarboxylase/phosphopantothenate--cysteine ligase
MAENPEILIGVGASIAAYKAADVVSDLKKRGAAVTVLMTPDAARFVSPLVLKTMSGRPVGVDLFNEPVEWGVGHVTLAKRARVYLITAATADLLAKLAQGLAGDFVTSCALVARCPLLLAPAMNTAMWEHPATRANLETLKSRGASLVPPSEGLLACGDLGLGKLADPKVIAQAAWDLAVKKKPESLKKRILITAGPTREALDPVRFLSNPSSGKMGYALAEAARDRGAQVTLLSGPTDLKDPAGMAVERVTTALEMARAARRLFKPCDIFISAAAVSDFRPEKISPSKVKKGAATLEVRFAPNPDILAELSREKGRRLLVGFAAETDDLVRNASAKLKAKNLDLIVANAVGRPGTGFASDRNQATLLQPGQPAENLPSMPKRQLAEAILDRVSDLLAARPS